MLGALRQMWKMKWSVVLAIGMSLSANMESKQLNNLNKLSSDLKMTWSKAGSLEQQINSCFVNVSLKPRKLSWTRHVPT